MKQHVVCCGLPIPESRLLYETLRSSMGRGVKSPERDMPALKAVLPDSHILTHRSEDVFLAAKIAEFCRINEKRPKLVIMVSDPVRELVQRDPSFPHQYSMGWDHGLERNANGIHSFTAPGGGAYAQAILAAIADEGVETLAVRNEQLHADPAREWARIEAFTGIDFSGGNGPAALAEKLATISGPTSPSLPASYSQADLAHVLRSFRLAPRLTRYVQRFGYEGPQSWAEQVPGALSEASNDGPGTIIGFYTEGTLYEQEARRLEASVRQLGLPIHIEAIPDHGSWLANVRAKPSILEDLRGRIVGPLLYVDVDAVFHADPWPVLRDYGQDAAFCTLRDGLARSGTVLINDSPGARAFLAEWKDRLEARPEDWDQHPLTAMLADSADSSPTAYTIGLLPVSMCYVFDRAKSKLCSPPAIPVIEHLQASRENEDRLSVDGGQDRLERRRERIAELDG